MTYHTNDESVKKIALAGFPKYAGRKFKIVVSDTPVNVRSYWSEGSRNYYAFVNIATLQASQPVPAQHPFFDKQIAGADRVEIPEGVACVQHSIFCGKDMGLTVLIGSKNVAGLLPKTDTLSPAEKVVLYATRSLKSSYAGIKNYRFVEAKRKTGIALETWEATKSALVGKGLLDKRGAITNEGKNALQIAHVGFYWPSL